MIAWHTCFWKINLVYNTDEEDMQIILNVEMSMKFTVYLWANCHFVKDFLMKGMMEYHL